MGTTDELCSAIASLGIPWAQHGFAAGDGTARPQRLPFVILMPTGADEIMADSVTYMALPLYDVELYTSARMYDLERQFEAALGSARIPWGKRIVSAGDGVIEVVWSVRTARD